MYVVDDINKHHATLIWVSLPTIVSHQLQSSGSSEFRHFRTETMLMSHLKSEFLLDLGKFHGLQTEQCGESRKNCDTNKLSNVEENIS
jgi:hypothetical protein